MINQFGWNWRTAATSEGEWTVIEFSWRRAKRHRSELTCHRFERFFENIARSEPKWSYLSRSKQNCCRCKWKMANHHRIWTKEAFIWSGGQAGWVATVLKEKTCHSTRQNRVWKVETCRQPPELLGRTANRPVRAGFSVWLVSQVVWTPLGPS